MASLTAPRICVSSASGGGGKTLLSLGLARAWTQDGLAVKSFKKGPDYIDAAWLAAASGNPCTNLDPFFLNEDELRRLFAASVRSGQIALIEGNRGLYDGLNESGECSTAMVARALACPIILCLNCQKTTRTMAAIIHGMTSFESGLQISGVILNRVGSSRHESALRRVIEANTNVSVLGTIPRLTSNPLPERHMGLASRGGDLASGLEQILDGLAEIVRNNCDIAAIMDIAQAAPPLITEIRSRKTTCPSKPKPVIGYVEDEALWFYYPENLQALGEAGCELRRLSFFSGPKNWENIHGIYLGGGFPEDFASAISKSLQLQKLRQLALADLPVYAECGGLICLCESLAYGDETWPMAGIVPALAHWRSRPVGLGYVSGEICGQNAFFPRGMVIKGHEFHYCVCDFPKGPEHLALHLNKGVGLWGAESAFDGYAIGNLWASFTHIFAPALPLWAENFVRLAQKRMERGN